jgi:hypothetical protein
MIRGINTCPRHTAQAGAEGEQAGREEAQLVPGNHSRIFRGIDGLRLDSAPPYTPE